MMNRSESPKSPGTDPLSFSVEQPKQNWFFRYKIYHLPFWYLYHYLWTAVNSGQPIEVLSFIFSSPKFLFYVIFQACAVYFNLYLLIPRFLEKGKYLEYLALLILTIIIAASCIVSGYFLSAYMQNSTALELYGHGNFYHYFQVYTLPSTLTSMMLAMSIKLTKNWIQSRRKQQELEKEKLETELKFLKSQMNPHFLFNTINSIFVLIHKNPMMASESLAKFSDLLRYQLYECNEQQIPLGQELGYLENFIELQELREDHDRIRLQINIAPYATGNYMIAPFVLIPFIENAFKHVSRKNDQSNWIKIELRFDQHQLYFSVTNSISTTHHSSTEAVKHSGIGLKNVKRRLDLIYPGKHELLIHQDKNQFEVKLQLELQESNVPEQTVLSA
ncbi:MAG TPA: histidine kinase [Cyclobacteriaceae bacterium]